MDLENCFQFVIRQSSIVFLCKMFRYFVFMNYTDSTVIIGTDVAIERLIFGSFLD